MKKQFLFIVILFALIANVHSQQAWDYILKLDGSEIYANIIEVSSSSIKYTLYDYPNDPPYILDKSEIFIIKYKSGRLEKFTIPKETSPEVPIVKNNSEPERVPENSEKEEPLGFILQGHLGITIPFDEIVSEIYGYYPSFGITSGYFGKYFGLECIWDYSRKDGEPYVEGDVSDTELTLKINSITFSGYFASNTTRSHFFYVGGGIGYANIEEKISGKINGYYAEDVFKSEALKLQLTGGMKIKHFFWEASISDVLPSEIDVNYGGLVIKAGFFF